jgi:hypothetical protein
MKIANTDIDIDIADRNKLLRLIKHTPAMMSEDNKKRKHNTGVYFHEVPEDPYTGLCTVDYKEAEDLGFFKLDILNVSIYNGIQTRSELDDLVSQEPMWELLEHRDIVKQLFHLHSHYEVVDAMRPTSVEQLAAVLAMIRPAKRHLIGKDWDTVFKTVWDKPSDGSYYFKKGHALAYALAIVVQMNIIVRDFVSQD